MSTSIGSPLVKGSISIWSIVRPQVSRKPSVRSWIAKDAVEIRKLVISPAVKESSRTTSRLKM